MHKLVVMGIGALLSLSSPAASVDTATMVPPCADVLAQDDPRDFVDAGQQYMCVGIVETIFKLAALLESSIRFCPPPGASAFDLMNIVLAYVRLRPEMLSSDFGMTVLVAANLAWPCDRAAE